AGTATGRRLGAGSPRLLRNGPANSRTIRITGRTRMMKVSDAGGLSDSKPNSHRNGHSGRGLAPASVGSGGPVGPFGPRTAARTATAITAREEQKASFSAASPRKGTPAFSFFPYSSSYVRGSTTSPGTGGALMPRWSTSHRWTARKKSRAPGMTNEHMQGEEAAEGIAPDHGAAQELADRPRPG